MFNCLLLKAIGQAMHAARARARLLWEAEDAEGGVELDRAFCQELTADFRNILDRLAEEVRTDVDRHIPCTLFHENQLVPAFTVGPVEFLPRADWIDRFVRDETTRSVVDRVEQGELTIEEVGRLTLEPDSGDAIHKALTVIYSLRGFASVGTVRALGHELRQSNRKMSTIVGLAIDAVGLLFDVKDARRFTKAGRAYLLAEDRLATAVDGGQFFYGSSANMPGLGSAPGVLAEKIQSECEFLDAAGGILNTYLENRQKADAPHLVEAWVNALYWVGEARREASDFMAVVKYGCAADVLSGAGGDSHAITEFAEAALVPKKAGEPHDSERSVADEVKMVYGKGRSDLAHGRTPGLLEDFSEPRKVGDSLLADLFCVVTPALAEIVADEESPVLTLRKQQAYRFLEARLRARNECRHSMPA